MGMTLQHKHTKKGKKKKNPQHLHIYTFWDLGYSSYIIIIKASSETKCFENSPSITCLMVRACSVASVLPDSFQPHVL